MSLRSRHWGQIIARRVHGCGECDSSLWLGEVRDFYGLGVALFGWCRSIRRNTLGLILIPNVIITAFTFLTKIFSLLLLLFWFRRSGAYQAAKLGRGRYPSICASSYRPNSSLIEVHHYMNESKLYSSLPVWFSSSTLSYNLHAFRKRLNVLIRQGDLIVQRNKGNLR